MELEMMQEYINQGNVLLSAGNPEQALVYFEKAEKVMPNKTEVYLNKGIAYAHMDKLDDAEKTFKKALLVDKKCGEAYFHMGCMSGLKGDLTQGIQHLDTAIVNGYQNSQVFFTLGMMYEEMDNPNMALRNYNKALLLEPVNVEVHIQKANLLIHNQRREEAVEALNSMIQNCPEYFEGYHLKCSVLSEIGKYDEAVKVLEHGLEMFPEEVGFEIDKARILVLQEKLDEAKLILQELETKNNEEWKREILLELARINGIQENAEQTKYYLEKAYKECKVDGKVDDEVCYLLMSVYIAEKEYKKVIPMAKDLIGSSSNETYVNIAYFYNAESLRMLGEEVAANEAYEATIKKCRATVLANPAAVDSYMIRALSLHRTGKHEQALEMIDYVIAISPKSAELHTAKATILKDLGRMEEMQKEVEIVNEIGGKLSAIASAL